MGYKNLLSRSLVAAAMMVPALANASLLGEYNLILMEDYNYQGGEVEGRSYIGGDINAAGQAPTFAIRETTTPGVDTVTVVGDVNAVNLNLNAGSLTYGGSLNVNNVNLNGGGAPDQQVRAGDTASMQSERDSIQAQLESDSNYFANMTANAVLNGGQLFYDGSEDVAVFDLDFQDVFAQNNQLSLNIGTAETVIINVAGTDVQIGGGVNLLAGEGFGVQADALSIGASNILWNFYEATSIDFNNLATVGSVLAVGADITGGAVFDGSVAARSYTGAREFHRFSFDWEVEVTSVSEPAGVALFGFSLLAMLRLRRKA